MKTISAPQPIIDTVVSWSLENPVAVYALAVALVAAAAFQLKELI